MGVMLPSVAFAQGTSQDIAEALFRDGKRLMDEGNFAAACPKLAESYRIDPGGGTLLNLGLCHKGEGKYASAATELREALALARKDQRPDRVQVAQEKGSEVEGLRSYVVLDVQKAAPDEEVKLDGVVVGSPAWQTQLPVDGGDHQVTATAHGAVFWNGTVTVGKTKDVKTVQIPAPPAPAPAAAVVPVASPPPETDVKSSHATGTAGLILGGVGIAAIGVGSYFGVRALSANSDSNKTCPNTTCSDSSALKQNSDAHTFAWIADIGIGAGVVALAAGAYLFISDSSKRSSSSASARAKLVPSLGPNSAGLVLHTGW